LFKYKITIFVKKVKTINHLKKWGVIRKAIRVGKNRKNKHYEKNFFNFNFDCHSNDNVWAKSSPTHKQTLRKSQRAIFSFARKE